MISQVVAYELKCDGCGQVFDCNDYQSIALSPQEARTNGGFYGWCHNGKTDYCFRCVQQSTSALSAPLPPLPSTPVDQILVCPVPGCTGLLFIEGDEVLCRLNELFHRWPIKADQ